MSTRATTLLLACALCLCITSTRAEEQRPITIVVGDQVAPPVQAKAQELAGYLEKLTGKPCPVVPESRAKEATGPRIWLGPTLFAKDQGVKVRKLGYNEWVIRPVNSDLLMACKLPQGMSLTATVWLAIGFLAQAIFAARFIIQWIASERAGRSYIPVAFWLVSLAGGIMLTAYAIYRLDPVFIVGQGSGIIVYVRNLMLVQKERKARASASS